MERGISFIGRIPFDVNAVKAVNNGQTIVDLACPSGYAVYEVYYKTMQLLFAGSGGG
jgi:hypothetical protein